MSTYLYQFQRLETMTDNLRKPSVIDAMRSAGFVWIRRRVRPFSTVLRNPTVGCHVELFTHQDVACVHIDSVEGMRLIKKLCYY